jgi:lipoprotein-anchoring transpeptidase ErfK/SrfK
MKLTGLLAGGAAVAGATLALLAPSGNGGPSTLQVAAVGTRPPIAGAPAVDRSHPHLLQAVEAGIPFPRWSERFPWKASGERTDSVGGRTTLTVYYDDPGGTRLAYTIVDGAALAWPGGSRAVVHRGVEVHVVHAQGRVIAAWREHGHSCVISAPDSVPEQHMIDLASARSYVS